MRLRSLPRRNKIPPGAGGAARCLGTSTEIGKRCLFPLAAGASPTAKGPTSRRVLWKPSRQERLHLSWISPHARASDANESEIHSRESSSSDPFNLTPPAGGGNVPALISGVVGILRDTSSGGSRGGCFGQLHRPPVAAGHGQMLRFLPNSILWPPSQGGGVGDCTNAPAPTSFMGEGQETSACEMVPAPPPCTDERISPAPEQ